MTILLLGWSVSRFMCCGYHRIVIPTEVEGPAVFFRRDNECPGALRALRRVGQAEFARSASRSSSFLTSLGCPVHSLLVLFEIGLLGFMPMSVLADKQPELLLWNPSHKTAIEFLALSHRY